MINLKSEVSGHAEVWIEHVSKPIGRLNPILNESFLDIVTSYFIYCLQTTELILDAPFELSAELTIEIERGRLKEVTVDVRRGARRADMPCI